MDSASGLIYSKGKFRKGSARMSDGKLCLSNNQDETAEVHGLILPKTVNCHSHIGDSFIQRPEGCSVQELVAPPDGLKHRLLRTVGEEQQVSSMRKMISLMERTGTSHFIDFRESGLEGTRRLLKAALGSGVVPVILARPESDSPDETAALLSVADGIGMSAISDHEYGTLLGLSEQARTARKAFAIHASEVVREDMGKILGLKPDLLVHMNMATEDDMLACGSEEVPAAICPSSNSYFGLRPQLRELIDSGITVCLGTDNAMLASPNLFCEIRKLRAMFPESAISDDEILEIVFVNGRKVLNSLPGLGGANRLQPDFFVLETPVDEPFRAILNARIEDIHMFATGGIT